MAQEHIHTLRSRLFQFVLNLRFFFIPYGMVYWMNITNGNTSPVVSGGCTCAKSLRLWVRGLCVHGMCP